MASRKYPLEQARRARESEVDRASRRVADAARDRADAEQRASAAARDEARVKSEADAVRAAEAAAIERGELTAADLARAHAWELRAAREREAHEERSRDATRAVADAARIEAEARGELVRREADAKVVLKHQEKWGEQLRRADEAREEEDAAEAWRPKGD